VSGIAALVWGAHPDLEAREVVERILRTADAPPNGWDRAIGYGVVNPFSAVTSIAAEGPVAASPRPAQLAARTGDAQERIRGIAMMTGMLAVAGAALVLVAAVVIRRGQRRRWRPGRTPPVTEEVT
jgi:hypothetical protein